LTLTVALIYVQHFPAACDNCNNWVATYLQGAYFKKKLLLLGAQVHFPIFSSFPPLPSLVYSPLQLALSLFIPIQFSPGDG